MADVLKHHMKVGDLAPTLRRKVVQDSEGVYQIVSVTDNAYDAVNLSNSSITGSMVNCLTSEIKIDNASATVEDEDGGIFYYQWALGDTDTPAPFDFTFRLMLGDGAVFHLPSSGYIKVVIEET